MGKAITYYRVVFRLSSAHFATTSLNLASLYVCVVLLMRVWSERSEMHARVLCCLKSTVL